MGVRVREKPVGSDVWWVFIAHNRQRRSKRIGPGEKNRKLAEQVAEKIRAKMTLKQFKVEEAGKTAPTFGTYADTWKDTVLPTTCAESTVKDYRNMLKKHILPVFKNKPVDEITRLDVKTFLLGKSKRGYAKSTVRHMKDIMSGILRLAIDDGTLRENMAQALGKNAFVEPGTKPPDSSDILTPEELELLLATFKKHFPRDYPIALTLARTGMRKGEALGLQWGDIDFHNRNIVLRRSFSKGRITPTKSKKVRTVEMSKQLAATLKNLRTERKEETLRKGWREVPEWVFVNEDGSMVCGDSWTRRVFSKALEKAGLREIRAHDLRHTWASMVIQSAASLLYVQKQLGHHSIKVTVDIYGHLLPGGNHNIVDALDGAPNAPYVHPQSQTGTTAEP